MKKSLTSIFVLSLFAATSAIAAGSVRIGGGGSMRAGSLKTAPVSEQSVSTTDTARMALSKGSSSLSKKLSDVVRVKETQKPTTVKPVSETDVANLESRMADLQDALEKATAQLEDMKETFYTKSELDARLPQWEFTPIGSNGGVYSTPGDTVIINENGAVMKEAPNWSTLLQDWIMTCPDGCRYLCTGDLNDPNVIYCRCYKASPTGGTIYLGEACPNGSIHVEHR